MNDQPETSKEQAEGSGKAVNGGRLQRNSPEELRGILDAHAAWDRSVGKRGTRANLQEAILLAANLKEANLEGANLQKADLEGANLKEAKLRETDFRGANLQGVAELTQDQLDAACGDTETMLPDHLNILPCPEEQPNTEWQW